MGLFKIDWGAWKDERDKINQGIGYDLRDELRSELEGLKSYYGEDLSNKINYYLEDNVVGSKDWAPAIINEGRLPGEWPNVDAIRKWVRETKDGGKHSSESDHVINSIAYAVSKKIKEKGIAPKWYVDKVLNSK